MNSGPTLQQGSTGDDVRRLQRILVMIKELDYTGIDGVFGPNTRAAVESFQQGEGLAVDGIVGPDTWGALPADPHTPLLQRGASGADVHRLQTGLHVYATGGQGADPGPIDGDFGHCRRYVKEDLAQKLEAARFEIVQLRYFNFVGYFAWWLNFCLLRRRHFDAASVRSRSFPRASSEPPTAFSRLLLA